MKLSLVAVASLSLVACASPEDDEAASGESNNTAAGRVELAKRLTPITVASDGILPPGETERRGNQFVQGFFGGKDAKGDSCSVHVIHYTYRDGGGRVYLHAWRDADARGRAHYSEDFDVNVTGVETRDVIEYGPRRQVSIDDRPSADAQYRVSATSMFIKERQIVKSSDGDDARDVEIELKKFDEPGGGIVIRIKKLLADDVLECHDLRARKTVTP